jgi:type IV secretory pathway VirJ component
MKPFLFLFSLLALAPLPFPAWSASDETVTFSRFGTVTLYRQTPHPSRVVLFVSGDGGWNQGVVDMATELAKLDALVVGIDISRYLRALQTTTEGCSYPAADFEALSQFVQKHLAFPQYTPPVLVGYSSGATLVYAVLVQAPPGTFKGAISLGFCPDLPLTKPLCRGHGLAWQPGPGGKGYSFLPSTTLEASWVALQGTTDEVCEPAATAAYVPQVKNGSLISLPKVGHGFSVPRNWLPQFQEAFTTVANSRDIPATAQAPAHDSVKDLPLIEIPISDTRSETVAVILSGDGGWASIDRELGNAFAAQGIPVVGLNSLKYFWTRRTPDGAAKDLERVLRYYLTAWKKDKAVLIGYSRGADVLPFMANRLPQDLLTHTPVVALLGPARTVDFEFHLADWLTDSAGKTAQPVLPEVEKLRGTKILCFYGSEEADSLCKDLAPSLAKGVLLKGGHHFDGNYQGMMGTILREANVIAQ